jgi:hypothetical protein
MRVYQTILELSVFSGLEVFFSVKEHKLCKREHHRGFIEQRTSRETSNGKRKMEAQMIFLNPFTVSHHANGSCLLVLLLTKKPMEVICLQTD